MKERPLLFSSEMVRAILDGRKTQTRRVIKHWPPKINLPFDVRGDWPIGHNTIARAGIYQPKSNPLGALSVIAENGNLLGIKPYEFRWICPYGKPGDRLWVRETWRELIDFGAPGDSSSSNYCEYRADNKPDFDPDVKWCSPIFMPRWASRITLEIVKVRAERLQDITDTNGMYEGWTCDPKNLNYLPRIWFSELWERINAKRGYSWESNPWVWVIEFKKEQL